MADVLIYADSVRSADMRHAIPLAVIDPFLYAELGDERHVVVSSIERSRLEELDATLKVHTIDAFGLDQLLAEGVDRHEAELRALVRACSEISAGNVRVPPEFPLELADRLRSSGLELEPDRELFASRRRVKSEAELAGIRRAQRAAEAGMRAAATLLRSAEPDAGRLIAGAEPLTCERLQHVIRNAIIDAGAAIDEFVASHGAQTAVGHELGSGPIQSGEPIVIDLWPRDPATACYADMTRTFVVGEVNDELRRYHELTLEALERSRRELKPDAPGREVWGAACEPYERAGLPTQRTKQPGTPLEEGFFHSLGHGVGLEVHEPPILGRAADRMLAGDVVTLEPGCYRPGFGGCRLEDLLYVTEDGVELLTDFPYALEP
jgi:Xaa-Pro aminopeptidase